MDQQPPLTPTPQATPPGPTPDPAPQPVSPPPTTTQTPPEIIPSTSPQVVDVYTQPPTIPQPITPSTVTPQITQDKPNTTADDSPTDDRPSFFRTFLSIIEFFGTVALLVFLIISFGLQSFHVVGSSMTPTLQEGDRLLISKLGKTWGKLTNNPYTPKRGDIIVFKSPVDNIELVKRVIGLPGERVVLESGKFTVYNDDNPKGLNPDEAFNEGSNLAYTAGNINVIVPEGEIFVSGDNRTPGGSLDSRNSLGTVPIEKIDGKLILRVLPITEAKAF